MESSFLWCFHTRWWEWTRAFHEAGCFPLVSVVVLESRSFLVEIVPTVQLTNIIDLHHSKIAFIQNLHSVVVFKSNISIYDTRMVAKDYSILNVISKIYVFKKNLI